MNEEQQETNQESHTTMNEEQQETNQGSQSENRVKFISYACLTFIFAISCAVWGCKRASGFWYSTWIFIECFINAFIGGSIGCFIGLLMRDFIGEVWIESTGLMDLFIKKLLCRFGMPIGGMIIGGFFLIWGIGYLFHDNMYLEWFRVCLWQLCERRH